MIAHSERRSVDDYYDIPRGEECKQLVEQLNRNLFTINSGLQGTLKQMTHLDSRIGHEIVSLSSCLQENLSKCTTSYAPHEEQLVQLDTAKRNLKKLTSLLEARAIFDSEDGQTEKLKNRAIDDSLLPTLVAIGENLRIIRELGAKPRFDAESFHQTKDRYLTWKGTEFAMKFDGGLDEIYEAFATLNSVEDFYRLYQYHIDQSLSSLLQKVSAPELDEKPKSIKIWGQQFLAQAAEHFRAHLASICKYCDENEGFEKLLEAWKTFLKNGQMEKVMEMAMDEYLDYQLLNDLKSLLIDSEEDSTESPENIEKILISGILESAKSPLASKLSKMLENPPFNFAKIVEISTNLENFLYFLREISHQIREIYGESQEKSQEYLKSQILRPIFTDYVQKLGRMEENSAKFEEFLERIALGGQMLLILEEYQEQIGFSNENEVKMARKWMGERVKMAIRASHRFVTDKMPNHGSEVYHEEMDNFPKSALPTPQDFVVTATQNLLHLLRFWEETLANETAKMAISEYFKQKSENPAENRSSAENLEDEVLFSAILDKIAAFVVKKLLQSINDVWKSKEQPGKKLSKNLMKEFLCDAEYLRDALIDLRAGTHENLDSTIEKLREQIKNM
ncbi:unnamed protein product [Caenorhabditis angaria]|uniref:Component of oligomeric Golgi complex 7 n=1 Tax=Caenorhabditis angaria TaxID=860376 RepID=A0A9P1IGC2_9PELO|nr:unnamed protein product [Caenorhabditis angaria]